MDLNTVWFGLLGVLFIAYAVLDGFDLGVGMILPFYKSDEERRLALNSIGPVWDGNEVWLLTAGGALFAAFPHVYAGVFSGLYSALILLLGALIFRAVSLEVRSKCEGAAWRRIWDAVFSLCSFLIALLLGVAVGNLVTGMHVNAAGDIDAGMFGLLNLLEPIPLFSGVLAVCLLSLHGALFLRMKTQGLMQFRTDMLLPAIFAATVIFYIALTAWVVLNNPLPGAWNFEKYAALGIVPVLAALALVATGFFLRCRTFKLAFCGTTATIALLILTVGVGMFPNLVPAIGDFCSDGKTLTETGNSLTIYDSASKKTLITMLIIACLGIPLVALYHVLVYRAFSKKTEIDEHSY